jgi:hypothetical protein
MYHFLEDYWGRTKSEEIAGMLGSLSLLSDGSTADAAVWGDFMRAVEKAVQGKPEDIELRLGGR